MALERLLHLKVDFNGLDSEGRVKASLRLAATSEVPRRGEWVLLEDAEGNTCLGRVEGVGHAIVAVQPDLATWIPGEILRLARQLSSPVLTEDTRRPPTTGVEAQVTLIHRV